MDHGTGRARTALGVVCLTAGLVAPATLPVGAGAFTGRTAAQTCPANSTPDLYVNPTVKHRPKPSKVHPTGVQTPAICSYPRLSDAVAASAVGPYERIVADGATTSPAIFGHEKFPLALLPGVTLTTADDPAVSGAGLDPTRYVVKFKDGPADSALVLADGTAVNGLTFRNARKKHDARDMIACTDGASTVRSVSLAGDGRARVGTGLRIAGTCSLAVHGLSAGGFSRSGLLVAGPGSPSTIGASSLSGNARGVVLSGSGSLSAEGLTVTDNLADGILVGGVTGASTLTIDDTATATQIADNGGSGIDVRASGSLALTGQSTAAPVQISSNGEHGLAIGGAAVAEKFDAATNVGDGVLVDTSGSVALNDFKIHGSGKLPGHPLAGQAGLRITRADGAQMTATGERPTLVGLSRISDNSGPGVAVGDSAHPRNIDAALSHLDVTANDIGMDIADQGEQGETTELTLVDDNVFTNAANGLFIRPSQVNFVANKFHDNALNQVVFDGAGRNFDFTFGDASTPDNEGNAVYCYAAKQVFGIFAQGNSNVVVRHAMFEGGGTGLKDWGAQAGSQVNVANNLTAITACP